MVKVAESAMRTSVRVRITELQREIEIIIILSIHIHTYLDVYNNNNNNSWMIELVECELMSSFDDDCQTLYMFPGELMSCRRIVHTR